jgi:hypothetical protein
MVADHTPYQQKIIQRYYRNQDRLAEQRLAELVSDLYLSEGKKKERLWQHAAAALEKVGLPQSRVDYLIAQRDPALLAGVVKELQSKS